MKPSVDRYDVMSGAILVTTVVVSLLLLPSLPGRLPIHFDLGGRANGWVPTTYGLWILPAVALAQWLLFRVGPAILPGGWRERMETSPMSIAALAVVALLAIIQGVCLYSAGHPERNLGGILAGAIGLYSLVVAQLMPRLRRNPMYGIRNAWTLSSDENWLRTHRFAGYAMSLAGLAGLALAFLAPAVGLGVVVAGFLAPRVYAFLLARRLPLDSHVR